MSWQARLIHGLVRIISYLASRNVERARRKLEVRARTGGSAPRKLSGVDITTRDRHGMSVVRQPE